MDILKYKNFLLSEIKVINPFRIDLYKDQEYPNKLYYKLDNGWKLYGEIDGDEISFLTEDEEWEELENYLISKNIPYKNDDSQGYASINLKYIKQK
jgi:hypothetical protein